MYGRVTGREYFKSSDHGATWQSLTSPVAGATLAPGPGSVVYAWSGGSIYKSPDGGAGWRLSAAVVKLEKHAFKTRRTGGKLVAIR